MLDQHPDRTPPPRRHVPRRLVLSGVAGTLLTFVVLVSAVGALGLGPRADDTRADSDGQGLVFEIPYGAATRLDLPGITSAVSIPTDIRFGSDQDASITVINHDVVQHRAGPFLVGPGQTFVRRFPTAGVYSIACPVDPAESVVVTVAG